MLTKKAFSWDLTEDGVAHLIRDVHKESDKGGVSEGNGSLQIGNEKGRAKSCRTDDNRAAGH